MTDHPGLARLPSEFPQALRSLIRDELQAGNRIVEITPARVAPPSGLCVRLERAVTTRPRQTTTDLTFVERSSSYHSGEFADPSGVYFVIEPLTPSTFPDMDALRAELHRLETASRADRFREGGFW